MNNELIKILFLGDITGRQGRQSVISFLSENKKNYDFIIANIENASHGFGLTQKNCDELIEAGVDCFTSGNHIWDKKDIYEYIEDYENLLRPINYPKGTPGRGSAIFEVKGQKLGVINALGRVFMPPIDSPWQVVDDEILRLKQQGAEHIFIDFHTEATAEKICFAKYLANKYNDECNALIKCFCGTHTHVQTADEKIINDMAYITDAGFCGTADSVIGMEYKTSLKRLLSSLPERYEVAQGEISQINGVEIVINKTKTTSIKRIDLYVNNNKITERKAGFDFNSDG